MEKTKIVLAIRCFLIFNAIFGMNARSIRYVDRDVHLTVKEGDALVLNCSEYNSNRPNRNDTTQLVAEWYFIRETTDANITEYTRQTAVDGETLRIDDFKTNNVGLYKCLYESTPNESTVTYGTGDATVVRNVRVHMVESVLYPCNVSEVSTERGWHWRSRSQGDVLTYRSECESSKVTPSLMEFDSAYYRQVLKTNIVDCLLDNRENDRNHIGIAFPNYIRRYDSDKREIESNGITGVIADGNLSRARTLNCRSYFNLEMEVRLQNGLPVTCCEPFYQTNNSYVNFAIYSTTDKTTGEKHYGFAPMIEWTIDMVMP